MTCRRASNTSGVCASRSMLQTFTGEALVSDNSGISLTTLKACTLNTSLDHPSFQRSVSAEPRDDGAPSSDPLQFTLPGAAAEPPAGSRNPAGSASSMSAQSSDPAPPQHAAEVLQREAGISEQLAAHIIACKGLRSPLRKPEIMAEKIVALRVGLGADVADCVLQSCPYVLNYRPETIIGRFQSLAQQLVGLGVSGASVHGAIAAYGVALCKPPAAVVQRLQTIAQGTGQSVEAILAARGTMRRLFSVLKS